MNKSWRLDHDPFARPLGCNGKYGPSGRNRHRRRNEAPCAKCRASDAHYAREYRRGQNLPRHIHPCGTPAAAKRHRDRGEKPCQPCYTAEAKYHADHRAKTKAAQTGAAFNVESENLK